MLLPVSDDNDDHAYPFINVSLILICVFVFLGQLWLSPEELKGFFLSFGFVSAQYIPAGYAALPVLQKLLTLLKALFDPFGAAWVQAITSTFLHAGALHLAGNMMFLWIFGDNVEHVMGRVRYLAFFILTGILAQFTQTLVGGPVDIPCIGASGAISAVMGAYLVYHPNAIINVFLLAPLPGYSDGYGDNNRREDDDPFIRLKARTYLLFYFATQLLSGYLAWGVEYAEVAVWAHIGGYAFGFALAKIFKDPAMMFKEDADLLFGSDSSGSGLKKNVYNEYIFRAMPMVRRKGSHKRPVLKER